MSGLDGCLEAIQACFCHLYPVFYCHLDLFWSKPPSSAALWIWPLRPISSFFLVKSLLYLLLWHTFWMRRFRKPSLHGPFQSLRISASSQISMWDYLHGEEAINSSKTNSVIASVNPAVNPAPPRPATSVPRNPPNTSSNLSMTNVLTNLAADDLASSIPSGLSAPMLHYPDVSIATAWITIHTIVLSLHRSSLIMSVGHIMPACHSHIIGAILWDIDDHPEVILHLLVSFIHANGKFFIWVFSRLWKGNFLDLCQSH